MYGINETTSPPEEMIYADDCDFITRSDRMKKKINDSVDQILKTDNLLVNKDKTENTILERYPCKNGSAKEDWRKVKKLGSLLGRYCKKKANSEHKYEKSE